MKFKTKEFEKDREYTIETAFGFTNSRYLGRSGLWHVFSDGKGDKTAYIFMDDRWTIEATNPMQAVMGSQTTLRYTPDTRQIVPVYMKKIIKDQPPKRKFELIKILRKLGEEI